MSPCNILGPPMVSASQYLPIDAFLQAVLSCDLKTVEAFVYQFESRLDELIKTAEELGRRANSSEIRIAARKFSWKKRGNLHWAVVIEFNLIRADRILLVPTEADINSVVLAHKPGTAGKVCADCPKLLMRQIGRIVGLPKMFAPPPLSLQSA